MPALSPTMTEGSLTKWLIKVGDQVKSGEVIAEIETDKATMEVEAVDEGFVEKLLYKEGDNNIPVNKPIALIAEEQTSKSIKQDKQTEQYEKTENQEVEENKKNENKVEEEIIALDKEQITMRQAIRDTIAEEMRKDKKIFGNCLVLLLMKNFLQNLIYLNFII